MTAAGVGAVGKEMALDWFAFFCANLQTGFGPFVAVYLTSEKWTQTDIGIVLMIGGLVGLVCQVPGGLLVDRARSKPLVASIAVAGDRRLRRCSSRSAPPTRSSSSLGPCTPRRPAY